MHLYYIHKNENQFVAQYSFLFVFGSPMCFGQIYWPTLGSHMQRYLNLELSRAVTTVLRLKLLKFLKSDFS